MAAENQQSETLSAVIYIYTVLLVIQISPEIIVCRIFIFSVMSNENAAENK